MAVGAELGARALWVRESGLVVAVGENGVIVRSTDFGATWARVHSPTRFDLVAVTGRDGVMLAVGRDGSIARSDNEGRTWWLVRQEGPPLRAVVLGPAGQAIAVGPDGLILHSRDAGTSWGELRLDVALDLVGAVVDRAGVFHVVAREGLLVSHGPDPADGWHARVLPLTRPRAIFARGLALAVVDESGRAALSIDSGEQWAAHASGGVGAPVACWMDRTGEVFAVGYGLLRRSAGGSWIEMPVPEGADLTAISGDNRGNVFAVGRQGVLIRSIDGGESWDDVHLEAHTEFDGSWVIARRGPVTGVWGFGDGRVVVVGPEGSVSMSEDAGVLWVPGQTDTSVWLHDVWSPDDRSVHACGYGSLLLSTNGGSNWATVKKSRDANISRITGNKAGRRYALGPPDRLFAGRTTKPYWVEVILPTPQPLADVAAGPGGVVVLVGEKGTILRSEDSGNAFVMVESPTTRDLRAVYAYPPLFVAVGAGGTVIRSEDNGLTWSSVSTPARDALDDVWVMDDEVYAVGEGGVVIWSIDQGLSFLLEPAGVDMPLRRVRGTKKHVWVIGHDGADGVVLRHVR